MRARLFAGPPCLDAVPLRTVCLSFDFAFGMPSVGIYPQPSRVGLLRTCGDAAEVSRSVFLWGG